MEKVKEKVLEKIRKDLEDSGSGKFLWDDMTKWFAYIRALFDFELLTKEEAKELGDFIDKNSF
ncbi:MAG: hypothetical protein M1284_01035 [Candidatus Parvarchaeota archaeon]|jgi:hypothetical protein|uniref:Uncharacterized protein n=1 Tax=Candidatus Parvarchaeum acidophilus ARMAN-5 TaxID=662762 RepID=D6GWM9_PARA5|nr:MAG: hypothetical protein BJBARM5_0899 [Candidatus Parvarchaeum acidophilus ARMAN-5]MCL5420318.1 hypothetical protein [Candidatus Parvarchaeota archaeon]